jgi:CheY-like chemotaxis protein
VAASQAKIDTAPRVLVVDDDHAICDVIADLLEEIGLTVVCAHSDRTAYDLISALPNFAALIVDVHLGQGTTGFDVARFARRMIPALPVIYVSGQSSGDSFRAFGVPDSLFMAKPFDPETLVEAVRSRIPANR